MKVVLTDGFQEDYNKLFSMKPKYVLYRVWEYVTRGMWRELRWGWQRARRGYSDSDAWDTDNHLARIIPGMVRTIIDGGNSYPGVEGAETIEEWHEVLSKIARGFEAYLESDDVFDTTEERKRLWSEYEEGMALFNKWFPHLWD